MNGAASREDAGDSHQTASWPARCPALTKSVRPSTLPFLVCPTKTSPHMIPSFLSNGLLPEGLHAASVSEVISRFSGGSNGRRRISERVRRWIELCRSAGGRRFCLNGSYVTSTQTPNDADAVVWLGPDFSDRVAAGDAVACELTVIFATRTDEHLFAAENRRDWEDWIDFFSRTRDAAVRKGLVEVTL